jgi:hypothetical protein
MLDSYGLPVSDCLFNRMPLHSIDDNIIRKLRLFDFGPPSRLKEGLVNDIRSSPYLAAVRAVERPNSADVVPEEPTSSLVGIRQSLKKGLGETWSKSRAKRASIPEPAPAHVTAKEPVLGFYEEQHNRIASPVLAMYNLAKEKMEREQSRLNFDTMSHTTS